MANVYQQAAKQRKLIYLAAIVVLLVCSLGACGTFFRMDRRDVETIKADPTLALTLDGRAKVHELTELQQGDKELGGAAVQLLLTGSRAASRFAACGTRPSTSRSGRNGTSWTLPSIRSPNCNRTSRPRGSFKVGT